MAFCLPDVLQLPEPTMNTCQLEPEERIPKKTKSNTMGLDQVNLFESIVCLMEVFYTDPNTCPIPANDVYRR